MKLTKCSTLLVLLGLFLFSAPSVAEDTDKKKLQSLLKNKHPHIVTIQAVIKREMTGGGQSRSNEMKQTIQGVLIDDNGTILTSSALFSSQSSSVRGQSFQVENTPKQLNVALEGESEEKDAFLGATDDRFGLAFLQLKNPDETSFEPLDLGSSSKPEIGQEAVWVSRKAKTFDYAPYFTAAMISGKISKPREMWAMQGAGSPGLPVFTLDGSLLGVTVGIDADQEGSARSRLRRMLSGSGAGNQFLMPISDLKKVLRRARQQIKSTRKKIDERENEDGDGNAEDSDEENDEK